MKLILDNECQAMLAEISAFMGLGPSHAPGVVKDALMTGLLSRWAVWRGEGHPDNITIPDALRALLDKPVPVEGLDVEVTFWPAAELDRHGIARAAELLREWGEPESKLPSLWWAATGIGLAKFCGRCRAGRTGKTETTEDFTTALIKGKPQESE